MFGRVHTAGTGFHRQHATRLLQAGKEPDSSPFSLPARCLGAGTISWLRHTSLSPAFVGQGPRGVDRMIRMLYYDGLDW